MVMALACPMPLNRMEVVHTEPGQAAKIVPAAVEHLLARSSVALTEPVRTRMASSSASESALGPWSNNRSLGRSSGAQFRMLSRPLGSGSISLEWNRPTRRRTCSEFLSKGRHFMPLMPLKRGLQVWRPYWHG